MKETVIVSSARTAFGRLGGALKDFTAQDLGGIAIAEALKRSGIDPKLIDFVIMGQVLTAGQGQITARQAAVKGGVPPAAGAINVNKVCISSMSALEIADQMIKLEQAEVLVVGGQESMTGAPYLVPKARLGYRMGNGVLVDSMITDGLWDAFKNVHMGQGSDEYAKKYGITRQNMDHLSAVSHQRAAAAMEKGLLDQEIVPVEIPQKKGEPVVFTKDEGVRPDTTEETLAKLRPAFDKEGCITAGNASQINDGACATIVMSADKAKELGLKPLCTIVSYGWSSGEFADLHPHPANAIKKALKRINLEPKDMKLFEINEAFASVVWESMKALGLDPETMENVDVNGGAIAFGHPIGVSGCRIVTTLAYELARRGGGYGAAGICGGGGQGDGMIIKVD
ncbi:MAG: acetyl-CoA acetyltransferase [Candidatus Solincola sediminis]|uniref:Probable acetyl-CoA acetyltransferase n=1 Tax=Candidatus Solincola sediminis TaxID=1797199 RepID=A0A1F2WKF2_9ACTN|nr:MAG: acetyl-CoA acetyltransferase [Candidatus Solincola sediminis]OFW57336.1 MAG: acetyl-CoA acetyltransferase [Candidatus Solincola sediminis]